MAQQIKRNIFLSASIPLEERDPRYFETADNIAIRDAVISLVSIAIPHFRIVWGGHPSITPIINYILEKRGISVRDNVHLFQSRFFEEHFPEDNNKFENVTVIEAGQNRDESLLLMRQAMFSSYTYNVGIFIGGMDGVEDEYHLFREYHSNAKLIPLPTTGAAAKMLFERSNNRIQDLEGNYAFNSIFRRELFNNNQ